LTSGDEAICEAELKGYQESRLSRQQYCRHERIPVTRLKALAQDGSEFWVCGKRLAHGRFIGRRNGSQ
jgi:hypothetical protein